MEDGKVMINILYEDNHLLVVEKIPGILSQSDSSNTSDMLTILKKYIKEKYDKPNNVYLGLVHRLDKNVGGIMVFAKTSKAASRLSEQIRNREFKKSYLAVVEGVLFKDGEFRDYLKKVNNRSYICSEDEGKLAVLNFKVLDVKDNESLVKINLLTGRNHQIRVQFASRCHPLLGDYKYGKKGRYKIALYAYKLSFKHPTTKKELTFTLVPTDGYFKKYESILKKEIR